MPKSEWDVCAAVCIIERAGGRVSGLDGAPLVFNRERTRLDGLVASNGALHEDILGLLSEGRR